MKKAIFLFIPILFLLNDIAGQDGHEIKVRIDGVSDTVVYLGYHYGSRKLVSDTVEIDRRGNAVFKGDEPLQKGIYLVVMPSRGMNYFEILIADNQNFSVSTDTVNFVNNMRIRGCKENQVFNKYQKEMADFQRRRTSIGEQIEELMEDEDADNEDKIEELREKAREVNQERVDYIDGIIEKYPDFFFTTILLAMRDVDVPEAPTDEDGEPLDKNFRYHYTKKHYFDNMDFSERGLLRTPILESRINQFIEHMVVPDPDSMIVQADRIITKAYEGGDSLMYRFVASHLLRHFETSRIMGYDGVFVHIAENWYLNGRAYWANEEFLERLTERVLRITPNLIGNISPNLIRMQTFEQSFISLHQVKADYTVLIFWEPDCGHCRRVVPALLEEYNDTLKSLNVNVFALYTQYDRSEWSEFIEGREIFADGWYNVWDGPRPHSNFRNLYDIYSTPVIYVLAEDKRIVAKRVNVDDIKKIIEVDKKRQERNRENEKE